MGWTFTYRGRNTSIHDFFSEEFNQDSERAIGRVLKTSVVKRMTAYIAYERIIKETGERMVFCLVCLLGYRPKADYNFGYKDMDETMGPCATDCPEYILDMLTATDNENALEWRTACRQNIARRKSLRYKVGNILELGCPMVFRNGHKFTRLKVKSVRPLELVDEFTNLAELNKNYYSYYKCSRKSLIDHDAKVVA